jgi:hypothetical protein
MTRGRVVVMCDCRLSSSAGSVHRLTSGEVFAVEIRPDAHVEIVRGAPGAPLRVVFSDPRFWPYAGGDRVPVSLVLPADVARTLFVQGTRLVTWGELPP